jgi:hypothetical protein
MLAVAYNQVEEAPVERPFSTEARSANLLKAKIEAIFRRAVITGQTRTSPALFFARMGNDVSTSTEVIAETYELAIARLGLVLAMLHLQS